MVSVYCTAWLEAIGRLTGLARRNGGVLLAQHGGHVGGRQVTGRELVRIDPDAHAVIALAEHEQVADTFDAGDFVLDLDGRVIAQVGGAEAAVGRIHVNDQQDVRRFLAGRDPGLLDHVGQKRHGQVDAVLHHDLGQVEIDALVKGDREGVAAVVVGLRRHVEHPLDAVDLLLDRRRHGLGHDLGAGAGIGAVHLNGRRRHRRKLGQRQREIGQAASQRDQRSTAPTRRSADQ